MTTPAPNEHFRHPQSYRQSSRLAGTAHLGRSSMCRTSGQMNHLRVTYVRRILRDPNELARAAVRPVRKVRITSTPILRSQNSSSSLRAACASPMQKKSPSRSGDAIAEMSNLSGSFCPGNGTGEFANREAPTNQHTSVAPENALQFHHARETCKFAGNITSIVGLHLVSR